MVNISNDLKSHFLRLYQMAITDEEFSPLELKMLYKFAEDRGISSNDLDKILLSTTDKFAIPNNILTKLEYLYDLAIMIWADGKVTEDEHNTLKKYCRKFGFLDENIDELSNVLLKSVENGVPKSDFLTNTED